MAEEEVREDIKLSRYSAMTLMATTSLCIRCGKARIVDKVWYETINGSKVTFTQTVCPDKECQKIVDKQLQDKKDKIAEIQKESLDRRSKIRRGKSATR